MQIQAVFAAPRMNARQVGFKSEVVDESKLPRKDRNAGTNLIEDQGKLAEIGIADASYMDTLTAWMAESNARYTYRKTGTLPKWIFNKCRTDICKGNRAKQTAWAPLFERWGRGEWVFVYPRATNDGERTKRPKARRTAA